MKSYIMVKLNYINYTYGEAIGKARHLLVQSKVLLDIGDYSLFYGKVFQIIYEAIYTYI